MHDGSSYFYVSATSRSYDKLTTSSTVGTRPREFIAFPSVDARPDVVDDRNGFAAASAVCGNHTAVGGRSERTGSELIPH